ncbi:MAG: Lrp/AsnC family transcriptional regulator [Clostridia bacterium]|nr:Lrp/AsnC family transcriptional regulator [Clostridia bacterium]
MDLTDYKILACLKENARQNATEIGHKINLSTSAVLERIKKLESSGIIQQHTVLIDQKALGRELIAFINIRLEHPKFYESFVSEINARHCIAECYHIAGDFDFITKVLAENGQNLEEILADIKSINGVSLTRTTVVLSTNKHEVCLLPDKQKFM